MNPSRSVLIPHVTSVPSRASSGPAEKAPQAEEFSKILKESLTKKVQAEKEIGQVQAGHDSGPIKFSAHAMQRIHQRGIGMNSDVLNRLSGAVEQAQAKGLDDTLVLVDDSAFIINVTNRTVVTAMDKSQMTGNVFTNIDGAVVT